jgi:hypothetical protein
MLQGSQLAVLHIDELLLTGRKLLFSEGYVLLLLVLKLLLLVQG